MSTGEETRGGKRRLCLRLTRPKDEQRARLLEEQGQQSEAPIRNEDYQR